MLFFILMRICADFFIVCLYVFPLENQLSKEEGWDPINRFDSSSLLCLSQSMNRSWAFGAQMTAIVCFVDIGGIVDHHCLEVIVCFVDIGGIVDHHCLEVIVRFVDIGGIVDHHCLEIIVCFVDIGGIVDHYCLEVIVRFVDIGVNC